ncbi:AlpA family transcriptional regulator [Bradyrhizobium quebecense]|uniref:AlpA family phage regulatory protein n=1 Tax=Bradyrhizobium quebecense TaxID=2748629 RepID=A0A974AHU7_9BRAD|nr:AlpA family phage regulatory protein [Bradyrhizobium quebecense]UGA45667.1 AlpA family transcriptional regulator [Bradyrhizobium quebecense]
MAGLRKMLMEDQVLDIVPFSRTTLWRLERSGKFPRATYVSANKRCWFEDQLIEWQATVDERQPNRRRGKGRKPAAEREKEAAKHAEESPA